MLKGITTVSLIPVIKKIRNNFTNKYFLIYIVMLQCNILNVFSFQIGLKEQRKLVSLVSTVFVTVLL